MCVQYTYMHTVHVSNRVTIASLSGREWEGGGVLCYALTHYDKSGMLFFVAFSGLGWRKKGDTVVDTSGTYKCTLQLHVLRYTMCVQITVEVYVYHM